MHVRFTATPGRSPATVIATDPGDDLALLHVDVDGELPRDVADPATIRIATLSSPSISPSTSTATQGGHRRDRLAARSRPVDQPDEALDGLVRRCRDLVGQLRRPARRRRRPVIGIDTASPRVTPRSPPPTSASPSASHARDPRPLRADGDVIQRIPRRQPRRPQRQRLQRPRCQGRSRLAGGGGRYISDIVVTVDDHQRRSTRRRRPRSRPRRIAVVVVRAVRRSR